MIAGLCLLLLPSLISTLFYECDSYSILVYSNHNFSKNAPIAISGSGQQLVTAAENNRSPNGLWQVREGSDEKTCEVGTPVKCGQVIRLMHIGTGSNLHTHGIRSPLSNQHEVSYIMSYMNLYDWKSCLLPSVPSRSMHRAILTILFPNNILERWLGLVRKERGMPETIGK